MRTLAIVLLVAACGSSGGSSNGTDATKSADAKVFMDAPPNVPAMITIAGTAFDNEQNSTNPLAGASIQLLQVSDDSVLATATSGADGKYSMSVTTNGHVVDAYLLAKMSSFTDAAAFPAAPWAADDPKADSNLVKTSNFNLLGLLTGQTADKGFVVAAILDASGTPVAGATVASTPAAATYRYSDSNMTPTSTTSTNTDGAGFLINLPPGMVSISATKSGAVFKTHSVKAKAMTFTSTVITE